MASKKSEKIKDQLIIELLKEKQEKESAEKSSGKKVAAKPASKPVAKPAVKKETPVKKSAAKPEVKKEEPVKKSVAKPIVKPVTTKKEEKPVVQAKKPVSDAPKGVIGEKVPEVKEVNIDVDGVLSKNGALIKDKSDKQVKKALEKEAKIKHEKMVKEENTLSKLSKICPSDSFIVLRNINKIYDNHVQAVFNFNLEIKQGEFIVFVGPSGCGKSTTLRMIAGLEDITYGDLFIDGKYCNVTPPKDRDLAMVFQNYALYPHMNVYANMAFGIKIRKVYMPIYQPDQVPNLRKQLADLRREETKFGVGSDERKEAELRSDACEAALNDALTKRVPILAIDNRKIDALEKELENNKKGLVFYQGKYDKHDFEDEIEEKDILSQIENIKNNINQISKDIEYYKSTPVQATILHHLSKEEIDSRVRSAAKILNLNEYLERKPSALSGGQRQRVALGRAIVRHSKVLLMDEPLSNLDAKLRVQMRSEIVQLHERVGATTIYVTHDQTEAMTMADRIVVMKDGHVQQIGTPSEIYDHPSNTFVAGFIGSPAMNIFKAVLKGNKVYLIDGLAITLNEERLNKVVSYVKSTIEECDKKIANIERIILREEAKGGLNENSRALFDKRRVTYEKSKATMKQYLNGEAIYVEFGIRAEDIISGADMIKFDDLSPEYKAHVLIAEFLGHEYFIHFKFGDKDVVAKIPVTKKLIQTNDDVAIKFNLDKIHLFDFDSKKTIF